jgi:biopolymer transport protein ExbB/TolQ
VNAYSEVPLPWARKDFEQRLFFRGGRHTRVNSILAFLMGLFATVAFYIALIPFSDYQYARWFIGLGTIPYTIVFFSAWALAILFIKSRKIKYQRRALQYSILPKDIDFVLTPANVDEVIDRIYQIVDEPKHFVLFNRIVVALANLRNLGRVGDVDEILRSQASSDESSMETSYSLVGGFVWAIPVLGFIGTVLGLSDAIGGFGIVLQQTEQMSEIKSALQGVTSGLETAFVTTLQALVAALFIQLWLTYLKKSEQEFLDDCSEYCINNIVNRLRIMPFERVEQEV